MWKHVKRGAKQEAKQETEKETKVEDTEVAASAEGSAAEKPSMTKVKQEVEKDGSHEMTLKEAVAHATFRPDIDEKIKQEIKQQHK